MPITITCCRYARRAQEAFAELFGIELPRLDPLAKQATSAGFMHAVAQVAKANRANQDAIASMGGIRPLVELLNTQSASGEGGMHGLRLWAVRLQANAALALAAVTARMIAC